LKDRRDVETVEGILMRNISFPKEGLPKEIGKEQVFKGICQE